jgi:acetyl esterase
LQRAEIDPEILTFIDAVRAEWAKYPPLETIALSEARAIAEKVRAPWAKGGPVMASTTDHVLETAKGSVRVRVHKPVGARNAAPALIYLHGGGYTLFSIDSHDRLMREYAAQGGFAVVGVDYPLSPEVKYPVALDLVTALMLWLRENAASLGLDADRLALGGDSAGGNLSVATALRLRDLGARDLLKAVLANYAGFSIGCSDESEARFGGADSVMGRDEALYYWGNYLRDMSQADDPYVSPLRADLRGLPPTFLVIAECDIIAEHSYAMAECLRAAGVKTESKVYQGAPHSFLEAMSVSNLAREAIGDGARFVTEHIVR